jgi:hypothetical protein
MKKEDREITKDWLIAELSAFKERVKRLEHDLEIVYSVDTEAQKAIGEAQEQKEPYKTARHPDSEWRQIARAMIAYVKAQEQTKEVVEDL